MSIHPYFLHSSPSNQDRITPRGNHVHHFFIIFGQTFCVCLSELPSIYKIIIALAHGEVEILAVSGEEWKFLGCSARYVYNALPPHCCFACWHGAGTASEAARHITHTPCCRCPGWWRGCACWQSCIRWFFCSLVFFFKFFFFFAMLLPLMCHAPRRRVVELTIESREVAERASQVCGRCTHVFSFSRFSIPDPRSWTTTLHAA